jgi:adenylate kinase
MGTAVDASHSDTHLSFRCLFIFLFLLCISHFIHTTDNRRVLDAGTGDVWNVRSTDISEALCRRRYQVFKAHYTTILRLKSYFPFSLIDAMGSLEETRAQIVRELRYQSSLDLDVKTYAAIRHLPLAKDLVRVARQRLVFRLDSYCKRHPTL